MPVFTSCAKIKVKSLTTAFERHAQLHSSAGAPQWRNYFSSARLWFLSSSAGPQKLTLFISKNLRYLRTNILDFFITNKNTSMVSCCTNSKHRNIFIQSSSDSSRKLNRNIENFITFNTVNKDPGISRPHSHPHSPYLGERELEQDCIKLCSVILSSVHLENIRSCEAVSENWVKLI